VAARPVCFHLTLRLLAASAVLFSAAPLDSRFELIYQTPLAGVGGTPMQLVQTAPGVYHGLAVAAGPALGASLFRVANAKYETVHQFPPAFTGFSLVGTGSGVLFGDGGLVQGANRGYRYFTFNPLSREYREFPAAAGQVPGFLIASDGASGAFGLVGIGYRQYTLARISLDGRVSPLHAFTADEGTPYRAGTIVRSAGGSFFGIAISTPSGVPKGWLYRISDTGKYEKLAALEPFAAEGLPVPILAAADGSLYVGIPKGGRNHTGAILRATEDGRIETLIEFPAKGGMARPASLIEGKAGMLFGSTNNLPSYLFSIDPKPRGPNPSVLREVFAFDPEGHQGQCPCSLVQASDGSLYGAASAGGKAGIGTVFHVTGVPK
jgi:hypothetical protein